MMYFNRGFEEVGHSVQPEPEHRTKIVTLSGVRMDNIAPLGRRTTCMPFNTLAVT